MTVHSTLPLSTMARSFPKSVGLVSTIRIPYSFSKLSKYALRIAVAMAPPEAFTTIWRGFGGSLCARAPPMPVSATQPMPAITVRRFMSSSLCSCPGTSLSRCGRAYKMLGERGQK